MIAASDSQGSYSSRVVVNLVARTLRDSVRRRCLQSNGAK